MKKPDNGTKQEETAESGNPWRWLALTEHRSILNFVTATLMILTGPNGLTLPWSAARDKGWLTCNS